MSPQYKPHTAASAVSTASLTSMYQRKSLTPAGYSRPPRLPLALRQMVGGRLDHHLETLTPAQVVLLLRRPAVEVPQ